MVKKVVKESKPVSPTIGEYVVDIQIGRGAFGVVYKGQSQNSKIPVAIKTFDLSTIPAEEATAIELEVKLLQKLNKLNHPNIIQYIETIRTPETMNIILELAEYGSLQSVLRNYGSSFPESLASIYTSQILAGLIFLHEQGVIHRDIKPDNFLVGIQQKTNQVRTCTCTGPCHAVPCRAVPCNQLHATP